ncbi:hypothetical protein C2G38_2100020 [Gigaspora rosea]|uniref:Uncharacterized protein n=1 Tax=Gigaspora rosea TaxID=44941 RepID=A0A397UVR5_9GLOM|nr:hypothetical protein C2G38_2100020 [Gigaspora rosea]
MPCVYSLRCQSYSNCSVQGLTFPFAFPTSIPSHSNVQQLTLHCMTHFTWEVFSIFTAAQIPILSFGIICTLTAIFTIFPIRLSMFTWGLCLKNSFSHIAICPTPHKAVVIIQPITMSIISYSCLALSLMPIRFLV